MRRALRPYAVIETTEQRAAVPQDLPGHPQDGPHGLRRQGQVRVTSAAELAAAWESVGGVPCVLEKCCRWRWNAR